MANLVAFMLSNHPDAAVANLQHYTAFDAMYIYVHEKQLADFEAAYQDSAPSGLEVHFITHSLEPINKLPPLGAIRFHLFQKAQTIISRRDVAVMVDDDLKQPRWAQPGRRQKSGAQCYLSASSEIFKRELLRVAQEARKSKFFFFTGIPNARGHNGYQAAQPFKAVWRFSQLLGFFHDSPNPFDRALVVAEDYLAAAYLVNTLGTLPFLEHRGLVPEFAIVSKKYLGLTNPRNAQLVATQSQYPWMLLRDNYLSGVTAPRMEKKFLNRLKHTVAKEYR